MTAIAAFDYSSAFDTLGVEELVSKLAKLVSKLAELEVGDKAI